MFINTSMTRKKSFLVVITLIILTLGVYWPVYDYDFVSYDDHIYVTENSNIQSGITLDGLGWAFSTKYFGLWNPLVWLSFMFDFELFGFNAGGYHCTNVIIHIINVILLFYLFRNLTGSIRHSAFVAALFAIHPINVESVAWISERKNVLSTFFWMLTMLFYVWYCKKPDWKRYLPVLISFTLGLMSKQMLVTLPFVLLLIDYWPLSRTAINTQNETESPVSVNRGKEKLGFLILEKVPLLIVSVVFIWIMFFFLPQSASTFTFERTIDDTLLQRITDAIYAYGMYLRKLFWPSDLFIPYLYLHVPIWHKLSSAIVLIVITMLACRYFRKYPYLPVGWFWYLGTLFPAIGIIQFAEHTMADRYAYVTFIGLYVVIAWGAEQILSKKLFNKILVFVYVLGIGSLALTAYNQQKMWRNSVTLSEGTIEKDPKNYAAYTLLGKEMEVRSDYEKALYNYDMALRYNPRAYASYNNKAVILQRLGRSYEAIEVFRKAVKLNKYSGRAYYSIGLLYLEDNKIEESIEYLLKAIEKKPDYIDAYNLLGVALIKKGKIYEAIRRFEKALRIDPDNKNAQVNLRIATELVNSINPVFR
ncbi:MAG: tetratricopeptide repeat protein [Deltaproteobacteria bacterium]|nr:tetratricopeptide repeat protein [Deltaproteobacteria bacterium]